MVCMFVSRSVVECTHGEAKGYCDPTEVLIQADLFLPFFIAKRDSSWDVSCNTHDLHKELNFLTKYSINSVSMPIRVTVLTQLPNIFKINYSEYLIFKIFPRNGTIDETIKTLS